jgi:hypothetical protein
MKILRDFKRGEVKFNITKTRSSFSKEASVMTKHFSCLCFILLLVLGISSITKAKSVFAVASHGNGKVKAYLIDPNGTQDGTIDYQTTIPNPVPNATGLCLWPEKDRMFVTYEGSGEISWASIKNLNRDPDEDNYMLTLSGGNGLGGMAVDEGMSRLYVLNRGTNHVYAFDYDEAENTLVPIFLSDTTDYRTLPEVGGGFDIAIEPEGSTIMGSLSVGRLYVSDNTGDVEYYNLATWAHEGTITFERSVIGVGLDTVGGYLYGGNFNGGGGNSFLMRMPLDGDPNDYVEKNMGYFVMDSSVDEETGYLYLTSTRSYNNRSGAVEVYDPTNWTNEDSDSLVLIDIENDSDFGGQGPGGIAVGPSYKPPHDMYLLKVDDVEDPNGYVVPTDIYHYTIAYHPGPADEPNVVITDKLPEGVDFVSADPNWGEYFPRPDHKYVWELGYVDGYDPNTWPGGDPNYYFELTVQVNSHAEPKGTLYNKVTAESDWSYIDADETTRVDCWGGNTIYVDKFAPGPNIGTTWETAYLNLTEALARAKLGCGSVIRVADGTYKPGTGTGDYFDVPDNVEVYGGYAGYGAADPNERDWKKYKTILSGLISDTSRNSTVIKMGDGSLLDGVTVKGGNLRGIWGDGSDFTVKNCTVESNQDTGIYSQNGNLTIQWCDVKENGERGIYHLGSNKLLTVANCRIHDNEWDGIYTNSSTSSITNSLIYMNGSSTAYYGINLLNPSSSPDIYNNTIVDNINEGIRFTGSNVPDVRNNILYYNNPEETGSPQITGISTTYYCCIYDPNSQSSTPDGNGNITCEPDFVYDYLPFGYYHIKYESYCRNAGDNSVYNTGDVDMDNTERKEESVVDIGADEVACIDTWDPNDWTYDGVINLQEFSIFSAAWLSHDPNDPVCDPNHPEYVGDPNDPGYISQAQKDSWNEICDFDSDYDVDLIDFEFFCENWLWEACWREDYVSVMYGMSGGGGESSMMMAAPVTESAFMSSTALDVQPTPEKSICEQIFDLEDCIELLEKIWLEDPYIQQEIDPDDWKEFMDTVYESLFELKTADVEIEQ